MTHPDLLLRRLRVAHSAGALSLAYVWVVVTLGLYGPMMGEGAALAAEETFGPTTRMLLGVTTLALIPTAMVLWAYGRRLSVSTLRRLNLAGFASVVLMLTFWHYALLTVRPAGGFDSPGHEQIWQLYGITHSLLVWILLMAAQGLYIPQTPERCAALMGIVLLAAAAASLTAARFNPASQRSVLGLLAEQLIVVGIFALLCVTAAARVCALEREARALGPYRLQRLLGTGGMGEVWLAEHKLLKRPCAVKLIRPEMGARRPGDVADWEFPFLFTSLSLASTCAAESRTVI